LIGVQLECRVFHSWGWMVGWPYEIAVPLPSDRVIMCVGSKDMQVPCTAAGVRVGCVRMNEEMHFLKGCQMGALHKPIDCHIREDDAERKFKKSRMVY
jgi:hypothetical protein